MHIIKGILLLGIFGISTLIGIILSSNYKNRENELKEIKGALQMMKTKMKYTYEPIPEIFDEIASTTKMSISSIFKMAKEEMNRCSAGQAWNIAIEKTSTSFNKEDKEMLKGLGKMLRTN